MSAVYSECWGSTRSSMLSPTLSLIFMQLQSEKYIYIYIRFYLLVKSLFEVKFEYV